MKKTIGLLTTLALLTGTGCSGLPKLARALAKDPATVVVEVNTPYGKQSLIRAGQTTNTVIIKDGAVTINPK